MDVDEDVHADADVDVDVDVDERAIARGAPTDVRARPVSATEAQGGRQRVDRVNNVVGDASIALGSDQGSCDVD